MPMIVLIDDEPLVRESYSTLLQLQGFETVCFESAETCLQDMASLREARCLVVDYRLPGMNGCELLRKVRQQGVAAPAILLSGNIDDIESSVLHAIGRVQLLGKPCLAAALFDLVDQSLSSLTSGGPSD